MASLKIRFDVFKRDGFACAYCGKTPPEVKLEVDHIHPKSKGGKDDINNYVTACFECNRGKRNTPLSKIPKQLAENLEEIKEKELQIKEYNKYLAKIERRIQKQIQEINEIYSEHYEGWEFAEKFRNTTIKRFIQLLPLQIIKDSLYIAISRFPTNENRVIKYFCGICWHKIKGIENE